MVLRTRSSTFALAAAALGALSAVQAAKAQVDTAVTVVNATNGTGNTTLLCYGYDPVNDRMFTINNAGANQALRLISNVSGVQSVQIQMNQTAWLMFSKGGNTSYAGGNANCGGLLLNPQPIASLGAGAYSLSVVLDQSTNVSDPALHPELSQKLYRYNLQQDSNGDARDEFTSLVTLGQLQTAVSSATATTPQILRQFAWSGDGQSVYWTDSANSGNVAFNGLWKISIAGGTPVKLLNTSGDANTGDINCEPAVVNSAGIDSIYFRGGGSTSNQGGIDKITYDGTTASARTVVLSKSAINAFLELPAATTISLASMCSDADGNVYFNDTATTSKGLYKYDTQGRLSKVLSYAERQAAFGGTPNVNMLTQQPRTVSYTNGANTFNVTQILYKELSSTNSPNSVAGAYVFKVGDFNRDNVVNQTDIGLFKNKLTVKAGPALAVADSRYDLNGNGICSFKDVKTLQQFYAFPDGDATIDQVVDTVDFNNLAANFGSTSKTWLQGDFNGDETVDSSDFSILAAHFGESTAGPVAALGAAVPEPASLALAGIASIALLARRPRGSR